jgi:prephenate dehydrogenase
MSAFAGPSGVPPLVGIVGSQGAFGRWLARFLRERMGVQVIGRDPAGDTALSPRELVLRADVLVFSTPIRHAVAIIDGYVAAAAGDEVGKLWLDLTSIKQQPVAAMLRSRAEVAGLHPMTAPPKIDTLAGRTMAVCRARVDRWAPGCSTCWRNCRRIAWTSTRWRTTARWRWCRVWCMPATWRRRQCCASSRPPQADCRGCTRCARSAMTST